MTQRVPYKDYQAAQVYLRRKGIDTFCAEYLDLNEQGKTNTMYATKGIRAATPADPDNLQKLRDEGAIMVEVPFAGMTDFDRALLEVAEAIKKKQGQVTLADPVPIEYADKGEIRKLITRTKKSTTLEELAARATELQAIVDGYEERQADTEREDLEEKYQAILDHLDSARQDFEDGKPEAAISSLEDATYE